MKTILFIDGNNLCRNLQKVGLSPSTLNYEKLPKKLVGADEWVETRFYISQVKQKRDLSLYEAMTYEDKYDAAYSLSADGNFVPVVTKERTTERKVVVASPSPGVSTVSSYRLFHFIKTQIFLHLLEIIIGGGCVSSLF